MLNMHFTARSGACLFGAVAGSQAMLSECSCRQSESYGSSTCSGRNAFNTGRTAAGRKDAQGCCQIGSKLPKDMASVRLYSFDACLIYKSICRFALGQVMETLGDFNASADCFATSLQLEPSCPVLPFTSIPLVFD